MHNINDHVINLSILMDCNCKRDCLIALIVLNALVWQLVEGSSSSSSSSSLDSFLYDYAFKKIRKPRSGEVYDVAPPANFSGMEVAVVRVRTRSLWRKGITHGGLQIPPKTLPWPFTKRVDIVYQNLGNWSSHYYNLPNYTFVAPILGFLAYDSIRTGAQVELRGSTEGPVLLDFSSFYDTYRDAGEIEVTAECVRFDGNGTWEVSGAGPGGTCEVWGQGHFGLVVPLEGKRGFKKWWVVGIGGGVLGLVLVVLVVFLYKKIRRKKIKKMEEESERCEGLETIWIGKSKMPFASGIRTQPIIENSYLP